MAIDPKIVAKNVGVDDKALMMQMLVEMRSDIKQLSASISEQVGLKQKNTIDQTYAKIDKAITSNSEKTVEALTREIVENYKKERQKDREETQAKLKAGFSILGERFSTLSKSVRTVASSSLETLTRPNDKQQNATDTARNVLRGAFSGTGKLLAPEKIKKPEAGQINPEFQKAYDDLGANIKEASANDANTQKKVAKMVAALKKQQAIGGYKTDMLNDLVRELETTQSTVDDKKTIKNIAKRKKEEYIEKHNAEKKEALAEWQAEKDIFKEKNSTAAKTGRSFLSDSLKMFTRPNDNPKSSIDSSRDMIRKVTNYATKKISPWLGEGKKDEGQSNPNFMDMKSAGSASLAQDIKNDTKEILRRLEMEGDQEKSSDKKEAVREESIDKTVKKLDKENDEELEEIDDVKARVGKLSRYVRVNLKDDILDGLKKTDGGAGKSVASAEEEAVGGAGARGGIRSGISSLLEKGKGIFDFLKNNRKLITGAAGAAGLAYTGYKSFTREDDPEKGYLGNAGAELANTAGGIASGAALGESIGGKPGALIGAIGGAAVMAAGNLYRLGSRITETAGQFSEASETSQNTAGMAQKKLDTGVNQFGKDVLKNIQSKQQRGWYNLARYTSGLDTGNDWDTLYANTDEGSQERAALDYLKDKYINATTEKERTAAWVQIASAGGQGMRRDEFDKKFKVKPITVVMEKNKEKEDKKELTPEKEKIKKTTESLTKPTEKKPEEPKSPSAPPKSQPLVALNPEKAPDAESIAKSREDALDDALSSGKSIKPPPGYRESNPSDTLKKSIDSLAEAKPAIAKMSTELKGNMDDNHKSLSDKLDKLNSKLDTLNSKKSQPATPPAATHIPPDQSFGSIQNMAKGYDKG